MQTHELKARVEELGKEMAAIADSLGIDGKRASLKDLETDAMSPDFWSDGDKARRVMREIDELKGEIETFERLDGEVSTLMQLEASELGGLEKDVIRIEEELGKFKIKTYLSGKYDRKNAIVSIHAGQGGTEAMDWASMLFRMYMRFCERKGWRVEVLDETAGEEAGIKSITLRVEGAYAYGYLKGEMGTHRLVRQSPFNADKLRQTSFAALEVLPEFEDVDEPDIEINDDDLEWQFFRASTQGGQNVQKVSTAVRLTHKPSGIVVTSQTERYQEQNRKIALNLLRSKLWAKRLAEQKETKRELKGEYVPASWGTQIRSYVLHPYKMVKDLRTEVETGNTEAVLDGYIDEFVEANLRAMAGD